MEHTIIPSEENQDCKRKVVIGRFVITVLDDDCTNAMRVFVMGRSKDGNKSRSY